MDFKDCSFFQVYNIFQVVFSGYLFIEACACGWLNGYSWGKPF